jgi:EAL domain-containing protein (putative c-di-GMP-specific phosphodiesterase class I)
MAWVPCRALLQPRQPDEVSIEIDRTRQGKNRIGRVEPYFQPIIDLETGNVIGFEALARCRASDGTLLMPDEFIPIAEQSGLISRLFLQVLKKGCLVLRHKPPHMTMAINPKVILPCLAK